MAGGAYPVYRRPAAISPFTMPMAKGLSLNANQPTSDRDGHRVRCGFGAQFPARIDDMHLDGGDADIQRARQRVLPQPAREPAQALDLACREWASRGWTAVQGRCAFANYGDPSLIACSRSACVNRSVELEKILEVCWGWRRVVPGFPRFRVILIVAHNRARTAIKYLICNTYGFPELFGR